LDSWRYFFTKIKAATLESIFENARAKKNHRHFNSRCRGGNTWMDFGFKKNKSHKKIMKYWRFIYFFNTSNENLIGYYLRNLTILSSGFFIKECCKFFSKSAQNFHAKRQRLKFQFSKKVFSQMDFTFLEK
jgi:hypothetical protein